MISIEERHEIDSLNLILSLSPKTAEEIFKTTHEEALDRLNHLTYKWLQEDKSNEPTRSNKTTANHEP